MRYRITTIGLAAVTLVGCGGGGTSWRRVAKDTYSVSCGRDVEDCYHRSGRLCPRGFDVQSANRDAPGGGVLIGNTFVPNRNASHALLVRCRRAK